MSVYLVWYGSLAIFFVCGEGRSAVGVPQRSLRSEDGRTAADCMSLEVKLSGRMAAARCGLQNCRCLRLLHLQYDHR